MSLERVGPVPLRQRASGAEMVVYVEDDADNWRVTRARLRRRFRLVWAKTSREACEVIEANGDRIFAVLMDIELKGSELDGIQLARLIRGTLDREALPAYARSVPVLPKVPILFVTAYGPQYPEAELLAAGGNRRLTKPVDFAELSLALSLLDVQQLSTLAIDIVKQAGAPGATAHALWAMASRDPLFSQRMEALLATELLGGDDGRTIERLRSLALSIVLASLTREHGSGVDVLAICLRRAVAAARIASRSAPGLVSECFALGMLLDAGLIPRARHDPGGVQELTESSAGERLVRERAAGEPEHPILGSKLAESWGLSKAIQEAVRYHHSPHDPSGLLGLAWAAELSAAAFEGGDAAANLDEAIRALAQVGLSAEDSMQVLAEVPVGVTRAAAALGRPVAHQPSLDEVVEPSCASAELRRSYRAAVRALGVVGSEKQELVRSQRDVNDELVSARDRDRAMRAAVQRYFLPDTSSRRLPGFDLFAFHRPVEDCGGDWWWCDPRGETPVVLVGDATGRGVEAAMVTASVASAFRLHRRLEPGAPVERILRSLNEQLFEMAAGQRAMTMSVIEVHERAMTWWTAAAPRILLARSEAREVEEVIARGTPVGATRSLVLGRVDVALRPKDRVVVFTDGVSDARLKIGSKLGVRRIAELVGTTRGVPAAQALSAIVASIDDARGGTPQEDDMTLLLLEVQ
jgi:serine phosphatase RsbU (regulator of sigma subunit)